MVVGTALVELRVHGSRSLKQKRGVVRSIAKRLRNRFNVSVAEVGGQDTWQRAVLGLATVAPAAPAARERLEEALDFVEAMHLAEAVAQEVQVLAMPLESEGTLDWDVEPLRGGGEAE